MIDLLRDRENNELTHRFSGRFFTGQDSGVQRGQNKPKVENDFRQKLSLSSSLNDNLQGVTKTGFLRFYYPILGRWVNRDPIQERGGKNIYVAFSNHPFEFVDTDGCEVIDTGNGLILTSGVNEVISAPKGTSSDSKRKYIPKLANPNGDFYKEPLVIFEAWREGGILPPSMWYGPDSALTQTMMNAPAVNDARNYIIERMKAQLCHIDLQVGINEPIAEKWHNPVFILSRINWTEQLIGGYTGSAHFNGVSTRHDGNGYVTGRIYFELFNRTGKRSYNHHWEYLGFPVTPDTFDGGPQSTFDQHYYWSENAKVEKCCSGSH